MLMQELGNKGVMECCSNRPKRLLLNAILFAVVCLFLTVLGKCVLADDWPMLFHDPGMTCASMDKEEIKPPLRMLWRYPIPDGFGAHGNYGPKPIVADGVVYVTGLFHEKNKEKKKSAIIALDALKGTLIWEKEGGFVPPAVSKGVLYTVEGKKCFAFQAKSGQLEWSTDITSVVKRGCPSYCGYVVVNNGLVYSVGSEINVLDAKMGKQIWKYEGDVSKAGDRFSLPAVDGDGVYFVDAQSNVNCLDPRTGALKWKKENIVRKQVGNPSWCNVAVADGILIITNDSWVDENQPRIGSKVSALSTKDGSLIWKRGVLRGTHKPILVKGVLYMTSSAGEMVTLDARTGDYICDRYRVVGMGKACGGLYYSNGLFYRFTGGAGGTREVGLMILDAKGDKVLWYSRLVDEGDPANSWTCGSACGGPTIANGILYLSTSVKGIFALVPDKGK